MKFIKHISFFLLLIVFFSQCKKNREPEPVTFNGTITDNVQGTPVANATVKIKLQQAADNGVFNSGFNTVATVTTDVNGNYSVTFIPEDPITYRIVAEKNLFYSKEIEISASDVEAGATSVNNLAIDPKGWFKVHIKNTNPNDADDNIIFQNTSEANGCLSCCNNLTVSLDGMSVDTTLICQRVSHPNITFSWFVTKNGSMSPFSGGVTAVSGDTVVYNLNY